MSGKEPRARRRLYLVDRQTPEGHQYNRRDAMILQNGDLVLEGYDCDPVLEQFVGRDEWEGMLTVRAKDIPRLREALTEEFGPAGESASEDVALLDLISQEFGGRLTGMTQFEEWLKRVGIEHTFTSY